MRRDNNSLALLLSLAARVRVRACVTFLLLTPTGRIFPAPFAPPVDVLKEIADCHPVVPVLLKHRKISKLKSTYISPLVAFAVPVEGEESLKRIHPMWQQQRTRTGRLSCIKPNLQNVPNEAIFSYLHPRDAFVSGRESTLFSCDYSQIEIRLLAHFTKDKNLIAAFRSSEADVYKVMSMHITGKKSADEVTSSERKCAKQIVLAVVYGMGIPQVAKKLGVSHSIARSFFDKFFGKFASVRAWMAQVKRFAVTNGYVLTITQRRRHLPNITSKVQADRAQAERQAVNSVIQGSAADVMKLGMLNVASSLEEWAGGSDADARSCPKMIMQIHDEVVFDVRNVDRDVQRLKRICEKCLGASVEKDLGIVVPLLMSCKVGKSWGNAMVDFVDD